MDINQDVATNIAELNDFSIGELSKINGLVVQSNEDLQLVADKRRDFTALIKKREEARTEFKKPFLEAGRKIDAMFKPDTEKLEQAVKFLNKLAVDYTNKIEKIRLEEQRKADEEAKKERLLLEAEAAKVLKIAQEKAEEIARQEAAARYAGDKEKADKLALKAEALIEKAEQKSDNLNALSTVVSPAPLQTEPAKVSGLAMKEEWYHRVIDADKIPREYLLIDDKGLAALAKASKGKVVVPGVEFYPKKTPMQTRK